MNPDLAAALFALAVAFSFGAGIGWALRATSRQIDDACTLPDPYRVLADDTTTRIQPTNVYDLPRRGRSTFEEIA